MKQQPTLFDQVQREQKAAYRYRMVHGGLKKTGKRKEKRPMVPRKWVHVVLKSRRAVGSWSLLKAQNAKSTEGILKKQSKRCHVEVKDWVNMGNHLHLKVRFRERSSMQKFLRVVPGLIARRVMGAEKGKRKGRFWEGLVFTRVLSSALESFHLEGYFAANRVERKFGYDERRGKIEELDRWIKGMRAMASG